MFPLFLDLTNRLTVVIGGGPVGLRKMKSLLDSRANVRLICLEQRPADLSSTRLEWLAQPYEPVHLAGASLAFAAATPEVNSRVVRDAQARGIWVNAAGDPGRGDFFVPAAIRRGDLLLAISTGGAAPALARAIRVRLEEQFDDAFGHWVALLRELRLLIRSQIVKVDQRRTLFEQLCQWEWLDRLRREGVQAVRADMLAEIRSLAGGSAD
jgi:precorrin-2 dehydrogenase/sirohydrochlorin ferrochelatase